MNLAFEAVDFHGTLRERHMVGICPPRFTAAVTAFLKEIDRLSERDMILFALDRAGAPREAGVDYPARIPPHEVELVTAKIYKVRMNGREFICEHTESGWHINQRQ